MTKQSDKVVVTLQVSTCDAKKQLDKRQPDKHLNETNEGRARN